MPSTGGRSAGDVLVPVLLAVFVIVVTAFLATVVLDMGQDSSGDDLAGASVQFDPGADVVGVTFTSMSRPRTTLDASIENASTGGTVTTATLSSVGEDHTFDGFEDGQAYRVVVVAEWYDQRSVVSIRSGRL